MEKPAGHAFISYVREDAQEVDKLQRELEAAGVSVWRDTADLWPGEDWRLKIRQAITENALVFIACFSSRGVARRTSYQNEELLLAIEQLRLRRPDDPWLIPVRFDDCDIPNLEIGGGRTLGSIQRADLFGDRRDVGMARLLAAVMRILGQPFDSRVSEQTSPTRLTATAEIDRSFRYSLFFVEPAIKFELYDDPNKLGVQVGVKFSNGFSKPIQVYLERLDVIVNDVGAGPYRGAVRKMRIMPNQIREYRAPVISNFPQGHFNGLVDYSVLYGPLDARTIYRHRHRFELSVTGVRVTAAEIRDKGPGASVWTDIETEVDTDMPEGYEYPDS